VKYKYVTDNMLLLLYEYPSRINFCLQLTSETVLATCRVNVITFFLECSFCTLLHLLFITCYPAPLSPFPHPFISCSECMLDMVQAPGNEYYNLRHLCIGVSERRICSPEVGTELFNQTNPRHARSERGKTQKILVEALGIPIGIGTW
jgi:hypothetical protein